ncbi:hypothetical protein DRN85_09660, partial [Methanosarcinales archaeon]
ANGVLDSSTYGNHGTAYGNTALTTNRDQQANRAYDFDGNGDFVSIPHASSFDVDEITVAAWIYRRDTGDDRVVCKSTGTSVSNHIFSLGVVSAGTDLNKVRVRLTTSSGSSSIDGTATFATNTWTHVAFTYDRQNIRIYVDGTEAGVFAKTGDIKKSAIPVVIGNVNLTDNRYFNGKIDDVHIYNRALIATEIQELYSAGTEPPDQAPIAEAGSNQTVTDADSNGSEQVTLNGSASYDSDGTIVSWVWTDDLGDTIPDGEITTAILSVGTHTITLTVTDDDGSTDTDTVTIIIDGEPKIDSLETLFNNVIDIWFDRPMDESVVEDISNYTIDYTADTAKDSIVVHNVFLDTNLNRARLFTSTHSEDVAYTLTANFIPGDKTYTSNLVGDWRFDEYIGIKAKDSSSKGNTATLVNGPAWTGLGDLNFDGNDDAVEISTPGLDAGQGTISLWVYARDFSGKQYLFSHSNQGATSKIQLYILAGILCLELGDSDVINWNEILDLQTWYHIALTWDGTTYAVYVNGVKKESSSYSGLTSLNTFAYIGNDGNSRSNAFNGVIDNVKIYDVALNADAISDIFLSEEVKENKSLAFVVSPMDGLTYSVQNQQDLPEGAVFDPNSNTFAWWPWYDQAGGYEVTFEGVDGSEQVQDTLTITAVVEDIELSNWYEQWLRHVGLL